MRRLLLAVLVSLLAGCATTPSPSPASPSPSPSPASPSPSASAAATIAITCGPVTNVSDCLAMVAAAAIVVPLSAVPAVRAEVGMPPTAAELTCPSCLGGTIFASAFFAAASIVGRVTFITPSGSSGSAWVITKPSPGYAGAVSINGVTPPPVVAPSPAPAANGPEPTETIAIDCRTVANVSDCVAMVSGAALRLTPGPRAEVTAGATPDYAAVTFITTAGERESIWVVSNPMGGWTGAYSINGVTPPP